MHSIDFIDNKWVSEKDATISVFDISVLRGFGIFDFVRTYNKIPFQLDAHIGRFFTSAKLLGLRVPKTKNEIKEIVLTGIKKNPYEEFNIRMVLTGGVSSDSISPGVSTLLVLFTKAHDFPPELYTKGAEVITHPFVRTFPEIKSSNYLAAVLVLQKARKQGAVEAVYIGTDGEILEGTTSNFFAVIDNMLVTPKDTILPGITRKVVFKIAKDLKLAVEERKLFYKELPTFNEAFLTASNKEVMPVVRIDGKRIGGGKVGVLTQQLLTAYRDETVK